MKILHVLSSIDAAAGGVARAVVDASLALARAGTRVDILSYDSPHKNLPWGDHPPPGLVLSTATPPRFGRFPSRDILHRLPAAIQGCDVLHLHGMWELLSVAAARAARRAGKPYLCSIHGMLDPWSLQQRLPRKRLYYRLFDRSRLAHAALLHFTAQEELHKAQPWLPSGPRTAVIPIAIDLAAYIDLPPRDAAFARFPHIPGPANDAGPWILFLSRLHEKKGLHHLIDAFAALSPAFSRTQLLIAGTGEQDYLEALRRQVARLGITPRVHFLGLVQGADKIALYRAAHVLAVPTSQENFGLVFPEALACETPVMLTVGVDIHRELLAADAAYLITQDPQNIRHALELALADPAANRRKGLAGRTWVLQNLQPPAIARQWQDIYESIVHPA